MPEKEEAARILLDAGWSSERALRVVGTLPRVFMRNYPLSRRAPAPEQRDEDA